MHFRQIFKFSVKFINISLYVLCFLYFVEEILNKDILLYSKSIKFYFLHSVQIELFVCYVYGVRGIKFTFPPTYGSNQLSKIYYEVKVAQLCLTLCNPMDSTVHGILQTRILEWVAFPFSRESSQPRI